MNNLEIERKFLVSPDLDLNNLPVVQHKHITQGYIYNDKYTEIRVRSIVTETDAKYYYTVKISSDSLLTRTENEFEIPEEIFMLLIDKIVPGTHVIVKDRYNIVLPNNLVAELDFFYGNLNGLRIVEVEFPNEELALNFVKPDWFLEDVTSNKNYKNKNLAKISVEEYKGKKRELSKK